MIDELGTTTYDVQDDKLRFYAFHRLDKEIWEEFKTQGFGWAPKQGCLFQVWSPGREDVCLKYSEEITEEESSLQERAELRFGRYLEYKSNAQSRAASTKQSVDTLTDGIPMGQPILVGHHSEKRARKDAERIQNGLHRYVEELKSADYWSWRAKATVSHASYLERPDVIARRIKKLKAEVRKFEREMKPEPYKVEWWAYDFIRDELKKPYDIEIKDLSEEEQKQMGKYIKEIVERIKAHSNRWLEHLNLRLAYEQAIYEGKGGIASDQKELTPGGAALFLGEWREIIRVNKNREGELSSATIKSGVRETWRSKWTAQVDDIKGIMTPDEWMKFQDSGQSPVVGKDYKYVPQTEPTEIEQAQEMLKNGVQVVVQDQLFPTPAPVIEQMLAYIEIEPGLTTTVLEPSAGTGAIAKRLKEEGYSVDVCEINEQLSLQLIRNGFDLVEQDFLNLNDKTYDLIVMNPPFSDHQDIAHVEHAFQLLKPGGTLVAIMSAGSVPNDFTTSGRRVVQNFGSWLKWHHAITKRLPQDAFKESGTMVNAVLVKIVKGY